MIFTFVWVVHGFTIYQIIIKRIDVLQRNYLTESLIVYFF